MKVAILLLNQGRGSGVVAKEHATCLLSQGHVVYYIHPNIGKGVHGAHNREVYLHTDIVPVHEYLPSAKDTQKAVSSMSYSKAMDYIPAYEDALKEIILETDIVIGHHANLAAIATSNICKQHHKPYVLFLHGTGIEPRHHGLYDNKVWQLIEGAIKEANGIIVTTEYVRDKLIRNLIDLPLDRFHIQACGVNLSEFNPDNTGDITKKYSLPARYVICPGALTKSKGPQNVVEASKQYYDLAETIFLGDGELREQLEVQLGNRGRFLGFVSNEDKAKLINAATLLVAAPDKKEHFGIIYPEAMAGSVPIVAYEGGGVNSIVTRETGVLTKRSPKSLGEAVRAVLLDEKRRSALSIKCRERAADFYSTDVLCPRLNNWLLGVLNAK